MLHYAGPPHIGGVEATIAAHARCLVGTGHRVRILAGNAGEQGSGIETAIVPEIASRGAEIEYINAELATGRVSEHFESLVDRITRRLGPFLTDASVLIVHNAFTLHKNLALTVALSRLNEAGMLPPTIAWCHDLAWIDPIYQAELHAGDPWDLLRRSWPGVRYVAVSTERQGILASLLELPVDQIAVVPPGIHLASFLKLEDVTSTILAELELLVADPLLLLPARITRRKNIELAIAITASLKHLGMTPRLVVTGPPGPHNPANTAYMTELLALARDRQVADEVTFLYEECVVRELPVPVGERTISDLFRIADALLFPSRTEGFGIPILEAALSGLPIFCTEIPASREAALESEALFSVEDPPEEIAGRIARVLHADARYARRRSIRLSFTWEAICTTSIIPLLKQVTRSWE